MVINPPLLLVSGLFFLALSSVLSVAAFLVVTAILRAGRRRISHTRAKQVLLAALFLPPILAAVPTFRGATLHHSHAQPYLEHHSAACSELFAGLLSANHAGSSETVRLSGIFVNGLAWLLVALGLFFLLRLIVATVRLERGLTSNLSRPLPAISLAFAEESADLTARRVENLISQAQKSASRGLAETRLHSVGSWALTLALAGFGVSLLLSAQEIGRASCRERVFKDV